MSSSTKLKRADERVEGKLRTQISNVDPWAAHKGSKPSNKPSNVARLQMWALRCNDKGVELPVLPNSTDTDFHLAEGKARVLGEDLRWE